MAERLTRDNLSGVWAALTTPFDEDDGFDEGAFRENLRRLRHAAERGVLGAHVGHPLYMEMTANCRREPASDLTNVTRLRA